MISRRHMLSILDLCLTPVAIIIAIIKGDKSIFTKISSRLRNLVWKRRLKSMGSGTYIYPHVIIHSPEKVSLGKNVIVNNFVHIWGGGEVEIGNDVMIAAHSVLTSITHDKYSRPYSSKNILRKIVIEENVWICSSAVILPGVRVQKHSIVGAGAVVTEDVPENSIVVGVPARDVTQTK